MRAIVYHRGYGCDTGCCGHTIELDSGDPHQPDRYAFTFSHPGDGEPYREFAEELLAAEFGSEHVADLDWENCLISED